ncbi:hypothetical protein GY45DRAFT_781748 [Cubamyces sp. BRFM 1775]|nr:hypothetical protein GY45DRAFT_781748 [Cubamyces sp. BRFM 1775]
MWQVQDRLLQPQTPPSTLTGDRHGRHGTVRCWASSVDMCVRAVNSRKKCRGAPDEIAVLPAVGSRGWDGDARLGRARFGRRSTCGRQKLPNIEDRMPSIASSSTNLRPCCERSDGFVHTRPSPGNEQLAQTECLHARGRTRTLSCDLAHGEPVTQ